ncbi:hypothetical protein [Nocardiopsis synnemataformans]|uniref:hypothetical protein n=2 Tax=Nocardiopsis synnemataformans TaxID=61305 RepID=UPI003EBBA92C
MPATVEGPVWAGRGLDQRGGIDPLRVARPVLDTVDRLLPGVSTLTHFARPYAFYAALAEHCERVEASEEQRLRLLRRGEVLMAAVTAACQDAGHVHDRVAGGKPHGTDGVRPHLGDDGLDLAACAAAHSAEAPLRSYSPRGLGFWSDYRGPCLSLGVAAGGDALPLPGRHACPEPVREVFAPLFGATAHDHLSRDRLVALAEVGAHHLTEAEVPWLAGLFTASEQGFHDPDSWEPEDLHRRAALRILGRTAALYRERTDWSWEWTWERAFRAAVAYGDTAVTDPVLGAHPQALGWRGALLRRFSVGAWRRLWSFVTGCMNDGDSGSGSTEDELRDRVASLMPDTSVRAFARDLPDTTGGGHPAAAEEGLLDAHDEDTPRLNVELLLLGARRAAELQGDAHRAFLGQAKEFLNPLWVAQRRDDLLDRPVAEFAAGLVSDMLHQSQRVAREKTRIGDGGRITVFSKVHERNGRYYSTGDEGRGEPATRINEMAGLALQLGLVSEDRGPAGALTDTGARLLEVAG